MNKHVHIIEYATADDNLHPVCPKIKGLACESCLQTKRSGICGNYRFYGKGAPGATLIVLHAEQRDSFGPMFTGILEIRGKMLKVAKSGAANHAAKPTSPPYLFPYFHRNVTGKTILIGVCHCGDAASS